MLCYKLKAFVLEQQINLNFYLIYCYKLKFRFTYHCFVLHGMQKKNLDLWEITSFGDNVLYCALLIDILNEGGEKNC